MIEFSKPNAVRLALKIAVSAEPHLGYMALHPDGSVGATDGVALVHSVDAHDADVDRPLYVRPTGRLHLSSTADSYALNLTDGVLIERRPRSEATTEVSVSRGESVPDTHRAVPGRLTPEAGEAPPFDSIIAGRLASDYGLARGVWRRGPWSDRVYLEGTDEGDMVVLAGIRRSE